MIDKNIEQMAKNIGIPEEEIFSNPSLYTRKPDKQRQADLRAAADHAADMLDQQQIRRERAIDADEQLGLEIDIDGIGVGLENVRKYRDRMSSLASSSLGDREPEKDHDCESKERLPK